jgi:HEAT repeat protein
VQRAGLNGLRFVDSKEVVPRIIQLTGSEDVSLVHSASLALARYDTPEAVARLIELTRHERPDVRCRACIDLSHSRRSESKAALAAALDDKLPSVRAAASTGLIEMLRAGSADDLLRKLAVLLKDEDVKVASNAAYAIGESRNPWGIEPLVEALQRKDISRELQYAVLGALYCHYNKDDAPEVKPRVEKHIDLVISALKNDDGKVGFGPAFRAVGILNQCSLPEATAALKWAAKSHPNAEIRGYAQSAIQRR